jgi:hypothetical protein
MLATDSSGCSALYHAVDRNHTEVVRLLLEQGPPELVDRPNADGCTPLMQAANSGHVEAMRLLLDYGAVINRQDKAGWTALHLACRGQPTATRLLLERGAAADLQTSLGYSAAMLAADFGAPRQLTLLLAAGASTDVTNRDGASAASLASAECARLLASRAAWRQGLSSEELEDIDQMVAARRQALADISGAPATPAAPGSRPQSSSTASGEMECALCLHRPRDAARCAPPSCRSACAPPAEPQWTAR